MPAPLPANGPAIPRPPPSLAILKPRHSAFYASPPELLLTEMQARARTRKKHV